MTVIITMTIIVLMMITVTGDDGDSGGDDKISKICSGGHSPP